MTTTRVTTPTNNAPTTPAPVRRAPIRTAVTMWRAERRTLPVGWFVLAAVVVAVLGQLLGAYNYLRYQEHFPTDALAWTAIWVQGSIMVTTIFLPAVYVTVCAGAASAEFSTRSWPRLVARDRVGAVLTGKALAALELAVIGMVVYCAATLVTGAVLGVDLAAAGPVLLRTLVAIPAAWALCVTMLAVGTVVTRFSSMMLVGMAGVFLGLAVTVGGTLVMRVLPFSMVTVAMGARDATELTAPGPVFVSLAISAAWIVAGLLVARWRLGSREW